MRKSLKQNRELTLPIITKNHSMFQEATNFNMDIKKDKHYAKPKLKRIIYPPFTSNNKQKDQILMVDSCMGNKTVQELREEIKQKQILANLTHSYCDSHNENSQRSEKQQRGLIGKQAPINYYAQYKKLSKVLERNQIEKMRNSAFVQLLHMSQSLDVLPCCLGIVKSTGQSSVINVNHYKLGDRYIQALSAGLKQAKMIEKCYFSRNRLTARGASQITKNISNDVSTIDLSHNKIRAVDQKLLSLIINNESRLQRLSLQNNILGDNSINQICRTAQYSKHLKVLNIRKNMLTNQSAEAIAELISKTQCLQQLYLGTNRICNIGAQIIIQALTNNQTIKVFDYSLNRLGQSNKSLASTIAQCFRKNKTLVHVDINSNYFNKEESQIIAQGLSTNKKIYGIHFRGNYGYVDSKGFIILKEKMDTTLHSIMDLQIQSYQINFRRKQRGFEPQLYKNVCWICQGWYEQEFKFTVPEELQKQQKKLVYIHFDFELFEPRLINLVERNVKYRAMVPPKKYRYFFTCNNKQYLDSNSEVQIDSYDLPICYTYQMYHQKSQFQVVKVSARNGKAKKIVDSWDQLQVGVLPRQIGLVTKRQKVQWTYKDSLWAKQWRLDDDDLNKKCFERDWKCSKISNLIKIQAQQDKAKELLWLHYKVIKQIYRHYSSWNPIGDVWAVTSNPFTQFCSFAKIVSKETPLKIIDLTFITTNSMSSNDWKGNQLVPERGLVRFQFMEALVRLSEQKYKKIGLTDNIFDSISKMLKEHILPIQSFFTASKWRLQKYFIEQSDTLIKKYRPIFSYIYKKNSKAKVKPGEKAFMCLAEFKSIAQRAGIAGSHVIQRDIFLSFNCSMMTQVDQLQSQRFMKMSQIQFIEGVARMAYLLPNSCKIETYSAEQTEFYHKFQWLIQQMKNLLCSEDIKSQFPTLQKSIFNHEGEQQ